MGESCFVCREIAGEVELPGGPLVDDELVLAFHVPPTDRDPEPYLGHLLVVPRRHVDALPDLTAAEAAAVMEAARLLGGALRTTRDVERVHLAVIGFNVPHFHLHVFPRYRGTPTELDWTAVDEWEGAPHGGASEVAAVVEEIRAAL